MPLEIAQDPEARLDQWLAAKFPDLSRARWQALIKDSRVRVNGAPAKPNRPVRAGDRIEYEIPAARPTEVVAQDIPLDVLYEDADLIVINKPPALVVHPAPGHEDGTLVNALLHHCVDLKGVGGELRPGIVHRLDQDTSGVLVVAKHEQALNNLAAQFKNRDTRKEYLALAWGVPSPRAGTIRTLIGRSTTHRKKMSARVKHGREAVSHYEVMEEFGDVSLLRVRIETGRTHQIRVHLAHIGHPVVGDALYGRARRNDLHAERQMLHAGKLSLRHPTSGRLMNFTAPIPSDLTALLKRLRQVHSSG